MAIARCWALGGRGCSQEMGLCPGMQAEEELNSVTVKHLFQRGSDMASLQCFGENHPLSSHFPHCLSHKCVSEPP